MANSPQARKRAKQNSTRRLRNMSQRSSVRSSIKKLVKAISEKSVDNANQLYRETTAKIDAAVSKGLHHKNKAARLKSRFNSKLKSLGN